MLCGMNKGLWFLDRRWDGGRIGGSFFFFSWIEVL